MPEATLQTIEPPKPLTDFVTGQTVRLKSGGPCMSLGGVIPTHAQHTQVECTWFIGTTKRTDWFYLGQLEVVSDEEAKAQYEKDSAELKELQKAKEQRAHEINLARANNPEPAKK